MKTMSIQQFCSYQSGKLDEFNKYWFSTVYPVLDEEDRHFWDYSATLWDWVEQYEVWFTANSAEL